MALDFNSSNASVAISLTPSTQAAAYASGNSIGGLLTFAGAARNLSSGGLIQSALVTFVAGVTPACDLVLFNASPSGSTITDKTAVAIVAADLPKVVGVMHLTDSTVLGATSVMQALTAALPFNGSTTTLYGALIARAAATLTTTTNATVTINVLQG